MGGCSQQRGLTLVEVLVALAILGLIAGSIMALIGQNTKFLATADDRMVAGIVADNEMTRVLARSAKLELGEEVREAELGGRRWVIEQRTIDSGIQGIVRIEIDVQDAARQQVAASATTVKSEGQ